MRTSLALLAGVLSLVLLPSCSLHKDMTKADLAAFKLRDLTRFGQPHIVKVSREELATLEEAERGAGHMASLSAKYRRGIPHIDAAPADYVPPSLPGGGITFDGSVLPPKDGGAPAILDVRGSLPGEAPATTLPVHEGTRPAFSIE